MSGFNEMLRGKRRYFEETCKTSRPPITQMLDLRPPGTTPDAVQNRGTQSCPGGTVEADGDLVDNAFFF